MAGDPFGSRTYKSNLKFIEIDNKQVQVDKQLMDQFCNTAKSQCNDNINAFSSYKENKLFPKKTDVSQAQNDEIRSKKVVKAFKELQYAVKQRKIVNDNVYFEQTQPPLEYTNHELLIEEKQKQRKLMKKIKINSYLSNSDSEFDEHEGVNFNKATKCLH